jgi:hypothetical protein
MRIIGRRAVRTVRKRLGSVCVPKYTFNTWVSNMRPARLYYAARDHICELCMYYKNFTLI